jgi:hypothetical protein
MNMPPLLSIGVRSALAVAAVAAVMSGGTPSASARDFFTSFFDVLSGRPPDRSRPALGYSGSGGALFPPQTAPQAAQAPSSGGGRSTAYCVRTCDGRYFPVSATNEQSRAATCSSLCPASDTRIFYGSSIDHATSESGKSYSSLPNAFKYREQLVSGCTCNGKDPVGLASVSIENDKTIRKGDIVAGENGLIVANRTADRKRGGIAEFTPAPQRIRAKFERSQALALQ